MRKVISTILLFIGVALMVLSAEAGGKIRHVPFPWGSYTGNHLTPGIIAFYRGDEASGNLVDASGNGRDMTQQNSVASDSVGIVNSARRFSITASPADTNYFTSSSSAFNFGSTPFTMTAWLELSDWGVTPGDFTIAGKGVYGAGDLSWWWWIDHGSPDDIVYFSFSSDGTYTWPDTSKEVSITVAGGLGAANYFAYVRWDGSTLKMSVTYAGDGSLAAETTKAFAGPFRTSADLATIGVNPGNYFTTVFTLDEIGFWARELSLCELGKEFAARGGVFSWPNFDSNTCTP